MTDVQAASLSFSYDTASRARRIERSIGVEVGEIDDERSRVAVSRDERTVRVEVTASDLVALRAGLNSWFRLVAVAETVIAAGETATRPE
ncbi:KEOPS complex subunit Pcc1 [Haloferacaceae archaeon DSL9]